MLDIDKIYNQDCLEGLKQLNDNSIDVIVTDPPYALTSIVKRFGDEKSAPAKYGKDGSFQRLSGGFMGKKWDSDVPSVDIWKECLRVLKPGAFGLVMCSPRQDSLARMICRLSDAGFETGFTSIYWTYFTGFPKSANIGRMVDKKFGVERDVVGKKRGKVDFSKTVDGDKSFYDNAWQNNEYVDLDITVSSTPQAKALDGSYAGYQPKPAIEIILVAMKPLSEKSYVDQALKNAKGVTWLDNCRVPYEKKDAPPLFDKSNQREGTAFKVGSKRTGEFSDVGRFPANLLVSDSLNDGNVTSSRYFSLDSWFAERIKHLPSDVQKVFPFLITPKASSSEKNKGLGGFEKKEVYNLGHKENPGRKAPKRSLPRANLHPTCKPIDLMGYLIILGSRENDVVLDPFIGSGTTGLAARMFNRHYIGFEISEEYCKIANARLRSIPVSLDNFGLKKG